MEDRQFHLCMKKMKAGDKAALREIYEAYAGYIFSVVLRVTGSREDAEDVTSDFFIKLWKLADTYEAGKGHRAWLAVVARNMAVICCAETGGRSPRMTLRIRSWKTQQRGRWRIR